MVLNLIKHISYQLFHMMHSPRLIGTTATSGAGSEETSAACERVTGDASPGSSEFVQEAVSEAPRAATRVMSPSPNDGVLTDVKRRVRRVRRRHTAQWYALDVEASDTLIVSTLSTIEVTPGVVAASSRPHKTAFRWQ